MVWQIIILRNTIGMFEVAMHIMILQTFVVVSLLGCLSLKTFKWRQKQFFFGQGNSNFQDMYMYM